MRHILNTTTAIGTIVEVDPNDDRYIRVKYKVPGDRYDTHWWFGPDDSFDDPDNPPYVDQRVVVQRGDGNRYQMRGRSIRTSRTIWYVTGFEPS